MCSSSNVAPRISVFFKIYRNVILEKFLEPALITGKIAKPP